ncbi:MAG: cytochrome c oxidase subunit 3 [Tunicatimonas sp.]
MASIINTGTESVEVVRESKATLSMHPKKFALWLFITTVVMIFASMTSAYIVRQSEGNWLEFELPPAFWITTGIILLSSVTMHLAYLAAKRDNLKGLRIVMAITTVLGIAFLVGQYLAWGELVAMDVYFVGNPGGSFVYVLSGLHAAHLIGGVVFLLITLVSVFRYRVHAKSMDQMEMCATYWHFLGGLWLYLFVFLLLN